MYIRSSEIKNYVVNEASVAFSASAQKLEVVLSALFEIIVNVCKKSTALLSVLL